MSSNQLQKVMLEDVIISANTGADAIKRAPIVEEDTGIRCLRIGDVSNEKPYKEWGFTRAESSVINKFLLKKDDIMIARTGNTIGVVKYIDRDVNSLYNNGLIRLRVNTKAHFPKYIFYNLVSKRFKDFVYSISGGTSTQPNMKIGHVLKYEVTNFSISEQKSISNLLSSLDEKIEINKQINKTLEEMAATIFKQWFVDFEFLNENGEPYRSNGGEMVESELGMIPKGWKLGSVNDLGTIIGGGTPSKKHEEYFTNDGIAWITPKDLSINKNKFISNGSVDITDVGLKNSSAKLMPKGTVLFSSRAPIGYIAISKNEVTTNQGFKSIIPYDEIGSEFVFQFLKYNINLIENRATGSTFKEISGGELKKISLVMPAINILSNYNKIVSSLSSMIMKTEEEIYKLTEIRETLLPKLMSGEIRVPVEE